MLTLALVIGAYAIGMWWRERQTAPCEVLSPEAMLLVEAMRGTVVTETPEDGVYTVYLDGSQVIRWFDGVRVRLLLDSGFTLATMGAA